MFRYTPRKNLPIASTLAQRPVATTPSALAAWAALTAVIALPLALFVVPLAVTSPARADTFMLASGGQVDGEWLNRTESPRTSYVVKLPTGGQITLTKKMVASVVVRSEAERRYEELLPKMPQSVDGHWKMAEWCKERGLDSLRENHLREIIKLEPDHEAARLGLGYTRVRGKWTTVEEFYKSQGYVRHGLTWRLPQELAMLTAQEKARRDEIEWRQKVKILRSKIGRRGGDRALEELRGIREPAAAPAIVAMFEDKNESRDMKMLCIDVLTQIDSGVAASAIMRHAIENDDDGIRDKCLDQLEKFKSPQMTTYFVRRLKDDDNVEINRAATALARLKDRDATLPLIDVLVTKHKQTVMPGGAPGSISPTFSSDGGAGLTMGGSPKTLQFEVKNDAVLAALVAIHPGINYQFDKAAWKRWYAEINTPRVVDLRRDG